MTISVMGLTVDLEKKCLYWLVRSYDGSELHRARTADQITVGTNEVYTRLFVFSFERYHIMQGEAKKKNKIIMCLYF